MYVGTLLAWGKGAHGQLGLGPSVTYCPYPSPIHFSFQRTVITQIATGDVSACIVHTENVCMCVCMYLCTCMYVILYRDIRWPSTTGGTYSAGELTDTLSIIAAVCMYECLISDMCIHAFMYVCMKKK